MNIGAISSIAASRVHTTPDVAPTSFTTTHSSGAPNGTMLDTLMSAAVDMDKAEVARKQQVSQLNPLDPLDDIKHTALNNDSSLMFGAFKKGLGSAEGAIKSLVISPS